jgi:hypothetical protein
MGWVGLDTSASIGPIVPAADDYDDNERAGICGMGIGRGKPAPMSLSPTQILHYLTWDRTRVAAVESRRLTA